MSDLAFRSKLAGETRRLAAISRAAIFGPAEPQSRPLNLQADAALMFPGYVGRRYRPGEPVLLLVRCIARFVPVEGNGTKWFGGTSFKLIVNANGEVVVHHVPT